MRHTKEYLIAFETRIAERWRAGDIDSLFHQSGGCEDEMLRIFEGVHKGDWVFASHRGHYEYLLAGGSEAELEQKIVDGKSMFLFSKRLNFFSSAILGGVCGIACGVALAMQTSGNKGMNRVHVFLGDGACDNGHVYEALRYAESVDLPIRFYVADDGMAADSSAEERGASAWVLDSRLVASGRLWRFPYKKTVTHCQAPCGHKITFKKREAVHA